MQRNLFQFHPMSELQETSIELAVLQHYHHSGGGIVQVILELIVDRPIARCIRRDCIDAESRVYRVSKRRVGDLRHDETETGYGWWHRRFQGVEIKPELWRGSRKRLVCCQRQRSSPQRKSCSSLTCHSKIDPLGEGFGHVSSTTEVA